MYFAVETGYSGRMNHRITLAMVPVVAILALVLWALGYGPPS